MKMKKIYKFVALILISISASFALYSSEGIGIVIDITGSVSVKYGEEGEWEKLKKDDMLFVGDTIKTGVNSNLVILLDDESKIEIGSLSVFTISEMTREFSEGKYCSKFKLNQGKVRLKVKRILSPDSYFEVHTPTAIAGVRGTDFTVSYFEEEGSKIAVFEGLVEVKSVIKDLKETFKVKTNQLIEVLKMAPPKKPKDMSPEEIEKMKTISLYLRDKLQKYGKTLPPKGVLAYLQAKVRGVNEEKVEELFNSIKEDKISEDDAKILLKGLDKKLLKKKEVEDTISLIKEKGIKSEKIKIVMESLKDKFSQEKFKDEVENIKEIKKKSSILDFEQKDFKDIGEKIKDERKPTEDKQLKEISKVSEIIKNNLPPEYVQKLIEGLKNRLISPEEAMLIVDAIKKGAKPEFILEIFKKLRNLKIDVELKKLIFTAVQLGLPPDKFKEIISDLNFSTTNISDRTIKEIKEKLREYIKDNIPKPKKNDNK